MAGSAESRAVSPLQRDRSVYIQQQLIGGGGTRAQHFEGTFVENGKEYPVHAQVDGYTGRTNVRMTGTVRYETLAGGLAHLRLSWRCRAMVSRQ